MPPRNYALQGGTEQVRLLRRGVLREAFGSLLAGIAAGLSGAPSLVVNLTSGLALAPKKTAAVYCVAKAGLRTFSKALRYQMQDAVQAGAPTVRGVDVMLPLVDTPMTAGRDTRVGKMDPESVAEDILSGLSRGSEEVYVGKASAFRLLHRWAPRWAERLLRDG
jgi:short-subunit dehydrogenase involved in D-alanine esterification of teichoic acids